MSRRLSSNSSHIDFKFNIDKVSIWGGVGVGTWFWRPSQDGPSANTPPERIPEVRGRPRADLHPNGRQGTLTVVMAGWVGEVDHPPSDPKTFLRRAHDADPRPRSGRLVLSGTGTKPCLNGGKPANTH